MEVEQAMITMSSTEDSHAPIEESKRPDSSQKNVESNTISMRGGGCITSAICDRDNEEDAEGQREAHSNYQEIQLAEQPEDSILDEQTSQRRHTSWPGWAELENDPDIFTIVLQEWGMQKVQVNEVYDITDLLEAKASSFFGLIFLSRYVSPDNSKKSPSPLSTEEPPQQPWFANQISKFSCGTVALMNILMNIKSTEVGLSETLTTFKTSTNEMNAKHKGIALDNHEGFRNVHNSFSTKLDQYIVDILLKEEAAKAKKRVSAQVATKKRKRGGGGNFTKRRKRRQTQEDEEEENGFHFVAYVSAHGHVWKLDGMQATPSHVGLINEEQTWLNVTVQDVLPLLQEALSADQQCTMMSVTKSEGTDTISAEERVRKQEDWAPFIETLVRIHAERGDLGEMLGL